MAELWHCPQCGKLVQPEVEYFTHRAQYHLGADSPLPILPYQFTYTRQQCPNCECGLTDPNEFEARQSKAVIDMLTDQLNNALRVMELATAIDEVGDLATSFGQNHITFELRIYDGGSVACSVQAYSYEERNALPLPVTIESADLPVLEILVGQINAMTQILHEHYDNVAPDSDDTGRSANPNTD